MDEIIKKDDLPVDRQSEEAYLSIRGYVIDAQKQVYSAVQKSWFFDAKTENWLWMSRSNWIMAKKSQIEGNYLNRRF